jgi:hypothetical protein
MADMAPIRPDAELSADWAAMPVLWLVSVPSWPLGFRPPPPTDEALAAYMPPGRKRTLRSFGHDADGVHWLITRGGTPLHHDPAYARYSHQLVLRNDGNRLRGLPRYDHRLNWHPPLRPGTMYALDTHSPHQGLPDERMDPPPVVTKLVIAVDRDELLTPEQAWALLRRLVDAELPATGQTTFAAPRKWGEAS